MNGNEFTRRFDGNREAWSLNPRSSLKSRTKSTRAKTLRKLNLKPVDSNASDSVDRTNNNNNIDNNEGMTERINTAYQRFKVQSKAFITDQWRRATQSGNDPFVVVTLKPTHEEEAADGFATLPILGGGSCVSFDAQYDNAEYTFLCPDEAKKDIHAFKRKYLKIEVYDKETGAKDRMIGSAHILLRHINRYIDQTQYAIKIPIYGCIESNYQWRGTVDIAATFRKITNDEAQYIAHQIQSKSQPMKSRINRSATDQIMILRTKSVAEDHHETIEEQMKKQHEAEQAERREKEHIKTRMIQGSIVNFVLFISLILSGTLFFGALSEYEVRAQTEFMATNYDTEFSIIDSFRWSLVTVTTIGYGLYLHSEFVSVYNVDDIHILILQFR